MGNEPGVYLAIPRTVKSSDVVAGPAGPSVVLSTEGGMDPWPRIPDGPTSIDDRKFLLQQPGDTGTVFYRREFLVRFKDDATSAQVRAFMKKYQAKIVGGRPLDNMYLIFIPDPGPHAAIWDIQLRMTREPGVWAGLCMTLRSSIHTRSTSASGFARRRLDAYASSVELWRSSR